MDRPAPAMQMHLTGGLDEECERETEKELEEEEEMEQQVPKMKPAIETDWDYSSVLKSEAPSGLATTVCSLLEIGLGHFILR